MKNKQVIIHLDPSVGCTNLGDEIISDAVSTYLKNMFDGCRIITMSSRDIGKWAKRVIASSDYVFLGGSNALSSNPVVGYRQFGVGYMPPLHLRNVVLMGVGWWQYQTGFGPFSSWFYNKILSESVTHSVRDEYTVTKLNDLGINNVVNTGCPTMWNLQNFSVTLADRVIFTLTDYNRVFDRDLNLIKSALDKFSQVYFWPQGTQDLEYLYSFSSSVDLRRVVVLNPTLQALDDLFANGVVYAGTRLHAGVRALQFQCPSYIVPIDNRATEMAKTESLTLIKPQMDTVEPATLFEYVATPSKEIDQFFNQFK